VTRCRNTRFHQHHNFYTTDVNTLRLKLVQAEMRTDMYLLQSSFMAPFKPHNKIIPGTS